MFVGLSYSAWTERAKWALDFYQISYQFEEYIPMLGEIPLRMRLGKWKGNVSVPVLFHEGGAVEDSLDISLYAESQKINKDLFSGDEKRIVDFTRRLDFYTNILRLRTTQRIRRNYRALEEHVPDFVPNFLKFSGVPLSYLGTSYILSKYKPQDSLENTSLQQVRSYLLEIRSILQQKPYIFDDFSFADISLATFFQFILPVSQTYIFLDTATRQCWIEKDLSDEFADLVAWRDQLYQKFR
ncbi:MAG: glutathione S-transferase N-terminal domain-containing protein [Spirochaetota bacterium]